MSDDTPTERFTPPSPPSEAAPVVTPSAPISRPHSQALIITLSIIGGLLLIAIVVLLTLLFAGRNGAPSNSASPTPQLTPSETPSATPSATPSETPSASAAPSTTPSPSAPPVSTGPVFDSFSPSNNSSAGCTSDSGSASVTFTWTSTGATEAAIGVATNDAFAGSLETGLPPSGSFDLNYQCNLASQFYTVSIKGMSGQTNKTITLKR